MVEMKSVLTKIIMAVLIPIIGVPLYNVGYTAMNGSFGSGDYSWAVTIYSIMFILVFALVPVGLIFLIFKDMN